MHWPHRDAAGPTQIITPTTRLNFVHTLTVRSWWSRFELPTTWSLRACLIDLDRRRSDRRHMRRSQKQVHVDAIERLLGIPSFPMSSGKTVTAKFMKAVVQRLGLDGQAATNNPDRLHAILHFLGESFDPITDTSVGSASRGGNTVTDNGLRKMAEGIRQTKRDGRLPTKQQAREPWRPTFEAAQAEARAVELARRGTIARPRGNSKPPRRKGSGSRTKRAPDVIAWVRQEARGTCELCEATAPFSNRSGQPYLEVHHVQALAHGGPDTPENAVALCPNCHAACHWSSEAEVLAERLYGQVGRLQRPKS